VATDFFIGDRAITAGAAPFIIAEAGVHHRNSIALAKRLVLEAAVAGADAVKFQTYSAARLAARWAPLYWSDSQTTQYDVFSTRSLLSRDDYAELFAYADDVGITLLSTPFDDDAAEMLLDLGMPAYKIASADITNQPLLERVASFGVPVLLSTGASKFDEIARAVSVFARASVPLALLHCSLAYPTLVASANLGRLVRLAEEFPDCHIGYSDHTRPSESLIPCSAAVALGACIVEKHFTLNTALPGDDHYHAVDPVGLRRLVEECHAAYAATRYLGEMTDEELPARQHARRSIVAARDIPAGTALGLQHVDFKRPGTGLPPYRLAEVTGRRLKVDVGYDEQIELNQLEDA